MGVGGRKANCVFRLHPKTFHVEQIYIPNEITFANETQNLGNTRKNSEWENNALLQSPHVESVSLLTRYFVGGIAKASFVKFNCGSFLRAISPLSDANFSHNINFADRRASIPTQCSNVRVDDFGVPTTWKG